MNAVAEILVVEDDRAMARGLEENLRFEGHRVHHIARGDEVVPYVTASRPDLLILDVMLPGLSGFEICRQIRRLDNDVPILLLTARAEEVDKVMGLDLGADDYLTKPFSLSELLARVRALVRRSSEKRSGTSHVLTFGDVSVDFRRYEASRAGRRIHLTAKEFGLLRHLANQHGAAVDRESLLAQVWGEDVNVTTRTVDTHVLALRQKLEPDPARPRHLLTVHGVGYKFVPDA